MLFTGYTKQRGHTGNNKEGERSHNQEFEDVFDRFLEDFFEDDFGGVSEAGGSEEEDEEDDAISLVSALETLWASAVVSVDNIEEGSVR